MYNCQKPMTFISDFSNYARKVFKKCYRLYYTISKCDNYQIYNICNFNYYAATNEVVWPKI